MTTAREKLGDGYVATDAPTHQLPVPDRENRLHPAIVHVLTFFRYRHLPEKLQNVSKPFCDLAWQIAEWAPDSPETTVALRKLLEAKDCAVRACL